MSVCVQHDAQPSLPRSSPCLRRRTQGLLALRLPSLQTDPEGFPLSAWCIKNWGKQVWKGIRKTFSVLRYFLTQDTLKRVLELLCARSVIPTKCQDCLMPGGRAGASKPRALSWHKNSAVALSAPDLMTRPSMQMECICPHSRVVARGSSTS